MSERTESICNDWENREAVQKLQLHIMSLVAFLNKFGTLRQRARFHLASFETTRIAHLTSFLAPENETTYRRVTDASMSHRLAELEEKLVKLERNVTYVSLVNVYSR